ncbi:PP2C family serine/threonine-protein phosphatase [Lyngbya confervoides]|uniref:Protein phosphatase 2C domain-containing protein n=1 Tax=Lyngbya confervoides BDU141951 TaxID=1574623 RepID=A0ABD4T8H0_9CYAN|nr:PP2C family serine/threonine-protein phosphatase [Lyngbya confervoides]MCM1984580.1 protein phosphatase 2C domain-containing protein [Lyngbya confervoides BDU141951]
MSWNAVTYSSVGSRHLAQSLPCQDYSQFLVEGEVLYGAVSDGAGSAKYADIGAQLAVQTCLDQLKLEFSQLEPFDAGPDPAAVVEIFERVAAAILERLMAEAQHKNFALKELNCTLIGFIATPDWMAAMQVGDGFIVLQHSNSAVFELLFQPEKGEYINETLFITSPGALDQLRVSVQLGCPEFIAAATDGLEKVAIRYQDWLPHAPFFRPFKDCLQHFATGEEQQSYLQTFLESDRLNAKTDDDKTLLICLHRHPEALCES